MVLAGDVPLFQPPGDNDEYGVDERRQYRLVCSFYAALRDHHDEHFDEHGKLVIEEIFDVR